MTKKNFRKRNKLDIILTDSRPVELPKHYSLVYFYNFLNKNKKMSSLIEKIRKEIQGSSLGESVWGPAWHAIPLKYHIYKNRFEMREMSLISPLSMVELPLFIEAYEKQLLFLSSEDGFSVRKHAPNDGLGKIDIISGKGVKYRYSEEKRIEFSGDYFKIYPYKYISEFQNSSYWFQLNREYRYFGKIDYSKCFDSIYTHTFSWIVTKNSVDGKDYGKYAYVLNMCDKLMQNLNGSVTNGIVVGPEFSRTIVEIITQHIDRSVKSKLFKMGICEVRDYSICRYVDDIFIFADEEKVIEQIIELFRDEAEIFHLHFNDQKRLVGKLPYPWFEWKEKVHAVNEYMCRTLFADYKTSQFAIKYNNAMLANLKMMYQNVVAEYPDYQAKITSYVLTTIYKRIVGAPVQLFSYEKTEQKLLYFLDAIFYLYSFSLSYNNTEKIISILDVLGNEIPGEIFKDSLHKVMGIYSLSLAKANPEDIANLVLLLSMYKIELPDVVESQQEQKIEKGKNPLMYSILLRYYEYNEDKKNRFIKLVETKIKEAVTNIYKNNEFFEYDEVWWLFIFVNCPLVSLSCKQKIRLKLEEEKKYLQDSNKTNIAQDAKEIVIDFLLDKGEKIKFVNWDLQKDELFEYTVFTTYKRTLFNGYVARDTVDEDDSY